MTAIGAPRFLPCLLLWCTLLMGFEGCLSVDPDACDLLKLEPNYLGAISQSGAMAYFDNLSWTAKQEEIHKGNKLTNLFRTFRKVEKFGEPHSCSLSKLWLLRKQLGLLSTKASIMSVLSGVKDTVMKAVNALSSSNTAVVGCNNGEMVCNVKPLKTTAMHELRPGPLVPTKRNQAAEAVLMTGENSFKNAPPKCVRVDRAPRNKMTTVWGVNDDSDANLLNTCPLENFKFESSVHGASKFVRRYWFGHEGPGAERKYGGRSDKDLGDGIDLATVLNELSKNMGEKGGVKIQYNRKKFIHPYDFIDELAKYHRIESYYMIQAAFGVQGRQVAMSMTEDGAVGGVKPFPPDRRLVDVVNGVVFDFGSGLLSPAYHTELKFKLTPRPRTDDQGDGPVLFNTELTAYQGHGYAGFYTKFYRTPNYLGSKVFGRSTSRDVSVRRMKLLSTYSEAMNTVSTLMEYPLRGYGSVGSCADLPAMVFMGENNGGYLEEVVPPFFPLFTSESAASEIQKYLKCRYFYTYNRCSEEGLDFIREQSGEFDRMREKNEIPRHPMHARSFGHAFENYKNDILRLLDAMTKQPSDLRNDSIAKHTRLQRMAFSIPWPSHDPKLDHSFSSMIYRVWTSTPSFFGDGDATMENESPSSLRHELRCPFPLLVPYLDKLRRMAQVKLMEGGDADRFSIRREHVGLVEYNAPNFDGTPDELLTSADGIDVIIQVEMVDDVGTSPSPSSGGDVVDHVSSRRDSAVGDID